MPKCLLRTGRGQQTFSVIQAYEASFTSQWKHNCQSTSMKAKIMARCISKIHKYLIWPSKPKPQGFAFWPYILYGKKVHSEFRGKNCTEGYLLCGGGTLFCLILGLETSVSCSICGTWEAILSELLSDTITDGSAETASEGASSGYLKNRKKVSKNLSHTTVKYSCTVSFWQYT